MKIYLNDLYNLTRERAYPIAFASLEVENNIYLRRLEDVKGEITFYHDGNDELRINYDLSGKMICPDAITLKDAEVPFRLSEDEKVVDGPDDEGFFLDHSMEAEEMALYIVLPEVPIKVVKNKKIEYSRGDGWVFVSDQDYDSARREEIDPRLQKLLEIELEEED